MKQYSENLYDDDLTVVTDDYDDSYYTGSVDLFEFASDEESPISRLKSLVLSIDWEITDEILMQFNEELVDLRDIWAGEKINLVYVQALEKISKYIYQKKADSHPSAIKLLLILYHNLEKIVSSTDLSEEEKKKILLEDVKRFENLKRHIGKPSAEPVKPARQVELKEPKPKKNLTAGKDLLNLKAIVLGIDWEITDQDLNKLREEVVRLEEKFADSRPKLILLQGIGTLSVYIKLKKSNTHADAFKVLHLFYESLEKIVSTPMTLDEEKAILFPAVERFNSFKALLGSTITPEAINRRESEDEEEESPADSSVIAPAFSDLPEDDVRGFQAEEEAQALGLKGVDSVDDHVESFFMGSGFPAPESVAESSGAVGGHAVSQAIALQGVDVESDDEEEDEVAVTGGDLAPALSGFVEETSEVEPALAFEDEQAAEEGEPFATKEDTEVVGQDLEEPLADADFLFEEEKGGGFDFSTLDRDIVLEGVKVETEADDDSDEEALPMLDGELAPALAENNEISIYNAEVLESSSDTKHIDDEIIGTLGKFFGEEEAEPTWISDAVEEEENLALLHEQSPTPEESEAAGAGSPEEIESDILEESPTFFEPEQSTVEGEAVGEWPGEEAQSLAMEETTAMAEKEQTQEGAGENPEDIWQESEPKPETEEETLALASEFNQDESIETFAEEVVLEEDIGQPIAAAVEEEVVFQLVAEDEQGTAGEPVVGPEGEETVEDVPADFAPASETDTSPIDYSHLQTCVNSLEPQLDDTVISPLLNEIERLEQHLVDKPLEKTFLLLVSTLTRHIDQNRNDSSPVVFGLLQSTSNAMGAVQENDLTDNLQLLFNATQSVLKWQEDLPAQHGRRLS